MDTVKVSLGERSYPIYIGNATIARLPEMMALHAMSTQCILITDDIVSDLSGERVAEYISQHGFKVKTIVFPAGEKNKNLKTFEQIVSKMVEMGVGRDWNLIALGGGVVGDLAGFVAASYMRGIHYIQVPTTLLAQVDSSVGGKVGVNHPAAKNLIGAFYQPEIVWVDTDFLKTLPQREVICGFAEIVKYGVICDREFYCFCEKNYSRILSLDEPEISQAISICCQTKSSIVAQDERDLGAREILNFGHTIGHAVETCLKYKNINHGEAILWGMLIESHLAKEVGLFPSAEFARFKRFLAQIPLKATIEGIDQNRIQTAIGMDKKVKAGKVRFVLPVSIGTTQIVDNIDANLIAHSLSYALDKGWS